MRNSAVRTLFLLLLTAFAASCGGAAESDSPLAQSVCDTTRYVTLSADSGVGVLLRKSVMPPAVRRISVYVGNTAPFEAELYEVRSCTPNRIYPVARTEPLTAEPVHCTPARRGFYTLELPAEVKLRGDLFLLFRAAATAAEAPRLAVFDACPEGVFFAVGTDAGLTCSHVESMTYFPPYAIPE